MLNKEKQIKNILIYIIPKIIIGIVPVITLPIFTRILTLKDYGVYALAEIYAILLSGIVNFGLTTSYERNFFQYDDKIRSSKLLYSTLVFVLSGFVIATVFTYFFKKPIARVLIGSDEYSSLLLWVFLAKLIMGFKQYFLIYFKNNEKAKDFVVYSLDETMLNVILSLFFVVYLKSGIIGLAWGQCIASAVVLSVLIVRFLRIMPFCLGWNVLLDSLKISLPLTPRIFMGVISTQLNKYILNILNTLGGVGIFNIAQRIANVTFIFMTTIQNVFNPQVYKKMFSSDLSAGKQIGRYLTPFVYLSIFICLLISLFSEEAVRLLTGPAFHAATPIVSIFSMYYGFLFFGKISGLQLIYKRKTALTSLLTIMDIGIGAVLSILFIKKFGVIGAAWATFFGGLIIGAIGLAISQHYFYIHWEAKKMFFIFGLFCASTLIILFLIETPSAYMLRLNVKILLIALYLCLGMRLQVLTKENFKIVGSIVNFKMFARAN